MCDDDMEDELNKKKVENNDILLFQFTEKTDDHKKYSLFKFNATNELPDEAKASILGKRILTSDLSGFDPGQLYTN